MESYSICHLVTGLFHKCNVLEVHLYRSMWQFSFLSLNYIYSTVSIDHILFICLSADTHLGCVHLLAIVIMTDSLRFAPHQLGLVGVSAFFGWGGPWDQGRGQWSVQPGSRSTLLPLGPFALICQPCTQAQG